MDLSTNSELWQPARGLIPAFLTSLQVAGGYSLPGFLAVSTFGVLNAIASEKTGSLLLCIVVHVLTNLLLVGGTSWTYS